MGDIADADFVPVQVHGHAGLAQVATLAPERLVAAMPGWAPRIGIVAIHRGERGPVEPAERARMRLARIEEGMADAAPAPMITFKGIRFDQRLTKALKQPPKCIKGPNIPTEPPPDTLTTVKPTDKKPFFSSGISLRWAAKIKSAGPRGRPSVINKSKRMVGILSLGDIGHSASSDLLTEVVKKVSAHHH